MSNSVLISHCGFAVRIIDIQWDLIVTQDVFVVTFPSAKHRDYYVSKDEAHLNFVKDVIGKVNALVADFESVC